MSDIPTKYRAWILKERPSKEVLGEKHLELKELDTPTQLEEGAALVKITVISFDAYQQIMAQEGSNNFSSDVGAPMKCFIIGKIVKTGENCKYPMGTRIHAMGSFSEYQVFDKKALESVIPVQEGISDEDFIAVGAFTTGLTAYVGLWKVCSENIKPGNTLVVSGASGGVGQTVIQIAKLEGLRVVGITGGEEKCKHLISQYGVDAAVNYKDPEFANKLREACPEKVDIYFDNVGGEITDTVFGLLNNRARVALCGLLSGYIDQKGHTFKNYASILMTGSRIEGFTFGSDQKLMFEGAQKIGNWLKEGKFKFDKHVINFEEANKGLTILFAGDKQGKLMARVN